MLPSFVPSGWTEIYLEAEGFNLALGLAMCSIAQESASVAGWGGRAQMMVRAALAGRPDMARWPARDIEREFLLETMALRIREAERLGLDPRAGLANYCRRNPSGSGAVHWWRQEPLPDIPRENHGYCLMQVDQGDPDSRGRWHGRWGALRCVQSLFALDSALPASFWAQGRLVFEAARAHEDKALLRRACVNGIFGGSLASQARL